MSTVKGISNVPKRLEQSAKMCVLLLLSELLRLRRPDLRPVEPENLINLVGRRGRLRPKRSDSKDAVEFVKENLALIPASTRPKDEAQLFGDALKTLTDGPGNTRQDTPAQLAATRAPAPFEFTQLGDPIPSSRFAEILSDQGLIAVPLPGFRADPEQLKTKPTPPIAGLIKTFTDPELSEPICRFIGSFFLAALLKGGGPPLLRAAAGAAALGCAVGISRGT